MTNYLGQLFAQQGCVGLWLLNGNSNDSSGGGFNGADTDITYSLANGKFGQGAGFNGSTSKIIISTAAGSPMRQTAYLTYLVWAKLANGGATKMGVASNGGQGSGGLLFQQGGGHVWQWTPTTPPSDRGFTATGGGITADTWGCFGFTIAFAGTPVAKFYTNGLPLITTISTADVSNGVPTTSYNNTNGDALGARYVNSFAYTNGTLGMVGIFNVSKSDAWFRKQYALGRGLFI